MPSPLAYPASCRTRMAWSGALARRLAWSWRRAPRPMARPLEPVESALIWDANLPLFLRAAQQFRFIDDRHAERLRALQLRSRVRAHHHRGGFPGDAVRHVAARLLDHLRRSRPGERGER